jgi:hypothetical protein
LVASNASTSTKHSTSSAMMTVDDGMKWTSIRPPG